MTEYESAPEEGLDLAALAKVLQDEYATAASKGYNAKALRKAIKIFRMDADKRAKHESEQSDLLIYLDQLEGKTMREAAE
jgi:uncharacterized protein (UPF0335 family)